MKLSLAACALLLCSCASDLASPFSAVAVTYDTQKQAFKLAQVPIDTLTSLRHLQGSSGQVVAGGAFRVDTAAILAPGATPDSLRRAFTVAQPAQVQLTWNVISAGGGDIVYPEDFASLELLSTYYNFEKGRSLLAQWGLTTLPPRTIVAHPNITDENGLSPLPDGELYYTPLATFFAPAATPQEQVPAAFNLGAVAHALAHQAIEEQVWGGAVLPAPELAAGTDAASITARHVARSMGEGIADYLGVSVAEDPSWFSHSLQKDAAARDLSVTHCGTPAMLDALPVDDASVPYDPYPLGSVIASALWDEGFSTTNQNTAKGVLAALPDLGARAALNPLSLAAVLDTLIAHAPAAQQGDLCGRFVNYFTALKISAGSLPSCSGVTVVTHSECTQ